ncbi:GlxA family transcriptional regulator [Constantimarinum furrinae]|uniref:AraC family Transcriptional regulator n=1 Tax=Constantimarinum furrinae TaxID=2562285 RepID=A0A7G8PWM4_9FLAO|nr:helix-turn-helix domain-containing protein [Constantimarinum furrinae]QNJ98740.1 AraC family Transcriptional regulator [Constantimarinum furrinae]
MKHVSILIPKGECSVVNIGGTHQMLSWVNEYRASTAKAPLFKIELVGIDLEADTTENLIPIKPQKTIKDINNTDLIIIPAMFGDYKRYLHENADFIPWMISQYKEGAEIVSLCIGSFFLATTGLLDGKQCSTHWQYANLFRQMFPKAIMTDDKIITECDGIYTSGGAYSFTNLVVYLIEKYAGRETAVMAAKGFMVDIDRSSQSPFMIFSGQKNHKDKEVLQIQNYIEQNFGDKFTVDSLCKKAALTRRTFERRFKNATSNTVLEYIQRVKVEAAKKELEVGRKSVTDVMYEVGYSDPKAFRDVFRKITDMTPLDYLNKYSVKAYA